MGKEPRAETRWQLLNRQLGSNRPGTPLSPRTGGRFTPELLYEKRWAAAVLESALEGMRRDYVVADDLSQFDALKVFVWGGANPGDYEPIARQLGVTEGAVKVAVHRMRKRFGEHLRREVARTVATPEDVESELRHLISVMGR